MTSLSDIIDRTSVANLCAGAAIVAGIYYFVTRNDAEALKNLVLLAVGYLFGRTTLSYQLRQKA